MKYRNEADFCEATSKLIAGLFVGTKRENTIFIPEVPYDYFSNNQIDMLLLDVKNLEFMGIEFKLNDYKGLLFQVHKLEGRGTKTIGIINSKPRPPKPTGNEYDDNIINYIPESRKVFSYTGLDYELELLGNPQKGLLYPYFWQSVFYSKGMVYYWAYINNKSEFRGGITSGGRDGFAKIYIQAIRNFHAHYGKLDFMITHATLNSGYSVSVSKKYYRQAIEK